jgi:phytoene synthase
LFHRRLRPGRLFHGAQVTDPYSYCRDKAAASGSSFYYAFRFLPAERRRAITCFYAFCREADDVVDECREPAVALAKLAWWREEVGRLYSGNPQHPVTQAMADVVGQFGIPRESLEEILDGMEMDLTQTRYADFKHLRLYCHRVAGVVGEVAARIFGHTRHETLDYAARLGLALQLTNILRDVGEDARRGRIYLPRTNWLASKSPNRRSSPGARPRPSASSWNSSTSAPRRPTTRPWPCCRNRIARRSARA